MIQTSTSINLSFLIKIYFVLISFSRTLVYLENVFPHPLSDVIFDIGFSANILVPIIVIGLVASDKICKSSILSCVIILGFVTYTLFTFPQNVKYIQDIWVSFVHIVTISFIILGGAISFQDVIDSFIKCSRVLFVFILASLIFGLGNNSDLSYMSFSDAVFIICGSLLYSSVFCGKRLDLIPVIILSLLLFFMGGRGSFLSLILLVLFFFLYKLKNKPIVIAFILIIALILIFKDSIINFMTSIGVESRTLSRISEGRMFDSQSRLLIYESLLKVLQSHPITGIGICGDRYYLPQFFVDEANISYAHNILLEILLDFGLIIGPILIVLLFILFIKELFLSKIIDLNEKGFLIFLFCMSFIQLLTSRSYLIEMPFYILLFRLIYLSKVEKV